jgi:hypothetical protein
MKFRKFRLQNADAGADTGSGSATLMTDGTQTTPAATSNAPADAAAQAAAGTDATQQLSPEAQAAADEAAAAANTPEAIAKAAEEKAAADKKAAENTAPEKYELKAPEGMTLDAEILGEFEGKARELNLSQEKAQQVTDLGIKLVQKIEARQAEAIQTAAAEWAASSSTDKEFGGDKLAENLAVSKKALDAFGTPELKTLLNESRLGNHPEVIRFMYRAGKAISEDRMVIGGAGAGKGSDSTAKALYPNQS